MEYLRWNNLLTGYFFKPEGADKRVYLSVDSSVIEELGRATSDARADFVAAVKAGPPWVTRKGICQKALQAMSDWRTRQLQYPPYVGYLGFFVLAAGLEGDFAAHAYYPRLRTLLGEEPAIGQYPSFDRMLELWDDLERWANEDRRAFPDGKVYRFSGAATPQCQGVAPIEAATVTFTQLPGTAGTNGATLVPFDGGSVVVDGNSPGAVGLVGFDGNTYNPTLFKLRTPQGVTYLIDETAGVTSITDLNGNTLTIGPSGVTSSSGASVAIQRDGTGRIEQITDPNGNSRNYTYNDNGDLIAYADGLNNTTLYGYDTGNKHNLTSIRTPGNQNLLTNTFDGSGHLTASRDGLGNAISFVHDVANRTETVTDRNGNATIYLYDLDGNVLQVTDPMGHITTSTYDADDNKLSETNGLGKTSTFTYL